MRRTSSECHGAQEFLCTAARRTLESLFEELVTEGVIQRPQRVGLADFIGEYSYLGTTLRAANIEPMPSLSDVRRLITEFAILPLGEHLRLPDSECMASFASVSSKKARKSRRRFLFCPKNRTCGTHRKYAPNPQGTRTDLLFTDAFVYRFPGSARASATHQVSDADWPARNRQNATRARAVQRGRRKPVRPHRHQPGWKVPRQGGPEDARAHGFQGDSALIDSHRSFSVHSSKFLRIFVLLLRSLPLCGNMFFQRLLGHCNYLLIICATDTCLLQVARALQPSVLYIDDCERMFKKKIPKTDLVRKVTFRFGLCQNALAVAVASCPATLICCSQ